MRMITSLRYSISNDAAHSAAWQIRETRRRAPRPPETHVEALWLSRAQPERVFRSMNGESVRVLRTGERNRHEGPDYLHALVVRDGVLYRGSIEIHVEADDWWRHGHASDARYRAVVLHVALYPPRRGAELPPTVLLRDQLDAPLREAWAVLLRNGVKAACPISSMDGLADARAAMLSLLARERLDRKITRLRRRYDELRTALPPFEAYTQCAWELLARAAGYGGNEQRMEELARSLPLRSMRSLDAADRFRLAGQACEPRADAWDAREHWRVGAVRPGNRALPRLRWLIGVTDRLCDAAWWRELRRALRPDFDAAALRRLLDVRESAMSPGPMRVVEIAVNVFAPLLALAGQERRDAGMVRDAHLLYVGIHPAPPNRITHALEKVLDLAGPHDSGTQQGMIELHSEYCAQSRCGDCLLNAEYIRRSSRRP